MDPAVAVTGEKQGCAFAMQRLVVLPVETVGQVGAVQLGALMQAIGQLPIGHRARTEQLAAMLLAGTVLVAALLFQATGQYEQSIVAKVMAKACAG